MPPDGVAAALGPTPAVVTDIVAALGGVTLAGGLYRVFDSAGVTTWTAVAAEAFPSLADRATVFAADWLGRFMAADSGRRDSAGEALVLLLDPGTSEALEVPVTVEGVHTTELLEAS